eukprot:3416320-Pleurochrysis_carterae.AAC.1
MEEDLVYPGVIEDMNLIASITEDYTFERAQTQIDNILVQIELLRTLQTVYMTTGVRGKDHELVVAEFAWEAEGEKEENRPTRRHLDEFRAAHRHEYKRV